MPGLRVVLLATVIFTVLLSYCESQDDGIVVSLGDREFPNHGLVTTEDIGVDRSGMRLEEGLKCSTTYEQCCTGTSTMTTTASWHHGHTASPVQLSNSAITDPFAFGMNRIGQAVYLFRNKVLTTNPTVTDGIWRCTIPDQNGDQQTKYIGIYASGTTGALSAGTPNTIQFSIVSEDPVVFNLTFRTTGGPATMVTWTRDSDDISSLEDSHLYTPSQLVVPNGGIYTAGDYSNILTVNGRLSGVYGVSVTNVRTTIAATASPITVRAHSTFSLSGAQHLTTIQLSWFLVDSSFTVSSYAVKYTVCDIWSGQCDATVSISINDITDTNYILDNVNIWATYNFTVSVHFNSMSMSEHILPLTSGVHTVTTQGLLAPELDSVLALNDTSVQVTWNQPEGGLAVDEFVVAYHRLNGRDGQCSSFQDEGSVTVRAGREEETNTANLYLQAYSVYSCTVTAWKGGGALYNDTRFNITTNSTVPSEAPQNLAIINSTSTSVTISWDSVECIHRNGLITHYIISYGPVGETNLVTNSVRVNNGGQDDGLSYTVSGLESSTNSIFKVAAVNEAGVGLFAVTQGKTINTLPQLFQLKLGRTDDCITWNSDKAGEIQENIRTKLLQVIQERCQCKLPEENLLDGVFSCLHSHNQTTYRSNIIGTHLYYDTELVGFIQDWVNSAPTVTIQWYTVKVDPNCPVGIASLDDPECEPTTNEECLYQDHPDIARCVDVCIARSRP